MTLTFLSYLHCILLNKFRNLERKEQLNPICRAGTLGLSDDWDEGCNTPVPHSIMHDRISVKPQINGLRGGDEVWSHTVVQQFIMFVRCYNPELLPFLNQLVVCGKRQDVQAECGLTERLFYRARLRLRLLHQCFRSGSHPPEQRAVYRDRTPKPVLASAVVSRS